MNYHRVKFVRFVPEKFEDTFSKYALTHRNVFTSEELQNLLKSNREPNDYIGWEAAYSEWMILYYLGKDKQGLLQKDTVRAVYDGSLFEKMGEEKASKKKMAAYSEWMILYYLGKDKQGLLQKDTVRAVYDGSLFEKMGEEKASKKKKK